MLNKDIFRIAYESIKGNDGALTSEVDGATLDGFSLETIENPHQRPKRPYILI